MGVRDVKTARVHLIDDGRREKGWRGMGGKATLYPKRGVDFPLGFRQEEYNALYAGGRGEGTLKLLEVVFEVLNGLEWVRRVPLYAVGRG